MAKTDRGFPTKKLKADAGKAKLDKIGKPSKELEYLPVRVSRKRSSSLKKR